MINLDKYDNPIFDTKDIMDVIYKGNVDDIFKVYVRPSADTEKFNMACKNEALPTLNIYKDLPFSQEAKDLLDKEMQSNWFMPDDYKRLNVYSYLLDKCTTDDEKRRVSIEYAEFDQRGLVNVLRFMVYLVDFMRENNIVWGVGRGSSVASYVLYLIGVHRIDSIQYGLDFNEFMR